MIKRLWCWLWGHDLDLEDYINEFYSDKSKRPMYKKCLCKRCNRYRKL